MPALKNVLPPYHLVTNGDMTSTVTSAATNVQYLDNICYQAQWTGTPTGTFSIQGSLDHKEAAGGSVINVGTWDALPLSTSITASGSADSAQIDLNQVPYSWLRFVYTASSGSGTLQVYVTGKAV